MRIYENKAVRFPKIISDILTKHYEIDSYHTFQSKIPTKLLFNNKLHKLACVVAFIQDEGNVREIITFTSANVELLSQLRKLTQDCGYRCNPIFVKGNLAKLMIIQ